MWKRGSHSSVARLTFSLHSCLIRGPNRATQQNSHNSESRRTPKFRDELCIKDSLIPVPSLIFSCSDWPRKTSFSSQCSVWRGPISDGREPNVRYSLQISLLAENWGSEKISHETAPTAAHASMSIARRKIRVL
jgi:hypothetical protein